MDIDEFRSLHCKQTRVVSSMQAIRLCPLGYNVFTMPRDPALLFKETSGVRQPDTTNNVGFGAAPTGKRKATASADTGNQKKGKSKKARTVRSTSTVVSGRPRQRRSYGGLGKKQHKEHQGDVRCNPAGRRSGGSTATGSAQKAANDAPIAESAPPPRARTIDQLLRDQRQPENRLRADSVHFKMQRPAKHRTASISNIMGIKFGAR
jgi:hypothetical protein